MRAVFSKCLPVALLALPLAACGGAPGILAPNESAHISKVQVSLAPNVSNPRFAQMLQARTAQQATLFGRAGAAKELRIVVERHSYKDAAMSLVVGDANRVGGRVAVIDVASGRVQGEVEGGAADAAGVNGVIGAIVAAAQDRQKVDERLADNFSKYALRLAFGSAVVDPVLYRNDPIIYTPPIKHVIPSPPEKAAPAARPAPASTGNDKTAMAVIPASAAR